MPLNPFAKKQKGDQAEQLACDYLQDQGLDFVTRNFNSRFGEIDLIMRDSKRDNLVFVEVRYRKNAHFGGAAMSVIPKKQQRIMKTALYYMQQHEPDASARFDVVAIEGDMGSENAINWIIDAFQ